MPDLVTYDVWELETRSKKPVGDDEGAEALAKEQFAFCCDIVMQGCGSIRGLVSALYSMVFLVGLIPKRNRAQRFSRNTDI